DLLATQPDIPWSQITRMRDHLAHRYFDTAHAILQATVDDDLPELERAIRITGRIPPRRRRQKIASQGPPAIAAMRSPRGKNWICRLWSRGKRD
ncbi:MAG: DUF86 domain-containing protein, partial [Streptosporangiaceae bacterium]